MLVVLALNLILFGLNAGKEQTTYYKIVCSGAAKQIISLIKRIAELSGANNVQSFETDGFVVGTDSGSNDSVVQQFM